MPQEQSHTKAEKDLTKVPDPAEALLKRRHTLIEKETDAHTSDQLARYTFFMACPDDDMHQAIYFTIQPDGNELDDNKWYATYKKVEEPWWEDRIWCQECLARGIRTSLPKERVDRPGMTDEQRRKHPFRIRGRHTRYLFRQPNDPEEFKRTPRLRANPRGSMFHNNLEIVYPEVNANG